LGLISSLGEKLRLFAARASWSYYQRADFAVSPGNGDLRIPILNGIGLKHLEPSSEIAATTIRELRKQGGTGIFVDIGANTGSMLLDLFRNAPGVAYVGCEPQVDAANYIDRLIRENHLSQHHVIATACGSRTSVTMLKRRGRADVGATLSAAVLPLGLLKLEQPVPVIQGDSLLDLLDDQPLFMLKIDVEGHEVEVIEGLRGTIAKKRPPVFFEILGWDPLSSGTYSKNYYGTLGPAEVAALIGARKSNADALDELFTALDYRLFLCRKNGTYEESGCHARAVEGLGSRREMDFLALPGEKASLSEHFSSL